uniref:Uncharacterized protein n=1 Tax=Arundo donax TaxID=35708 RepID=A0A0A8Y1Z5_ARUDO
MHHMSGVLLWCGGRQDGMQALLPYHLYPAVASPKELVPNLQIRRFCRQLIVFFTGKNNYKIVMFT